MVVAEKEFAAELIARMAVQPQWAADADRSGLLVGLLRAMSDHDAEWVARSILRYYAEVFSGTQRRRSIVESVVIAGANDPVAVARCLWPMCQGDIPGGEIVRPHVAQFLRQNDPGCGMLRPPLPSQKTTAPR